MMRFNIRILIIISMLPVFLISGCISSRTASEKIEARYYKPPAISEETLNERVGEVEKLLKENSLSEDRKETAISILKAYDRLKSLNRVNSTEKEYRKAVKLLFDTLVTVEKQYFYSGIVSADTAGEIVFNNYAELKKEIYRDYFAGNLKGVISGCDDLIFKFGKNALTPDLGIILVEALSDTNMTSEALRVARSILSAFESKPDLIRLLADTIELEIQMGNMENAKRLHEKLVDSINEKNSFYQKSENLLSEYSTDGVTIDESVKKKISEIAPDKLIELQQLTNTVEDLIQKKDFSGARLELVKRKLRTEEGPELDMIEELWKSVDKAEEHFDAENSNDKLIIEDAVRLIEQEKYEDSLEILEPVILEGNNYEAEKIKNEAIEKLIDRDNRIAARLRLMAIKERDTHKKKEFLLKAQSLFRNLIDKYPASSSIDKIKRNLSVVDEDLMQLPLN